MSVAAFDGSEYNVTFCILVLIFTVLSAISSIIVIFLIHKMKMTNGHSWLIWTMSWFQLLYDVSFFNAVIPVGVDAVYEIANIMQLIGGISGSLTSNVIAMISYYVVKNTKSVDVLRYYKHILVGVTLPSVVNSILYGLSCIPQYAYLRDISTLKMYYFIRVVSILFNFIICFMTYMQIRKISGKSAGLARTIPEDAIRTLAYRLMYYPIIQAISRSAVAWYEIKYHYDFNPSGASKSQFIAQCFMAILTPSASFGYLAVFLLMQPNAWECFKCTLLCRPYRAKPTGSLSTNLLNVQRFSPANAVKLGYDEYGVEEDSGNSRPSSQSHHSLLSAYDDSDSSQISVRYSFKMSQKDDDELWELIATNNGTDLWNTSNAVTERRLERDAQAYGQVTTSLLYKNNQTGNSGGSVVSGGASQQNKSATSNKKGKDNSFDAVS